MCVKGNRMLKDYIKVEPLAKTVIGKMGFDVFINAGGIFADKVAQRKFYSVAIKWKCV